ncbi:MAG TPA: hypothetical protein VFM54_24445 [Micromonosporaceae bacterium]|nr:hypothetical protein [Micromonosporaceae bacterium]
MTTVLGWRGHSMSARAERGHRPETRQRECGRGVSLVFVDTETTSLRPDRRAWEVGLIVRDDAEGGQDDEYRWLVAGRDLDLGNADPFALRIGRFHQRHPEFGQSWTGDPAPMPERQVLFMVERLTRGAHLVGNIVSFDAEVLGARMRAHGILPSWHYHLIDIEAMVVGYLCARGERPGLPWDSEALSSAVGVAPTPEWERHTALGDARWARDLYDAVAGLPRSGETDNIGRMEEVGDGAA